MSGRMKGMRARWAIALAICASSASAEPMDGPASTLISGLMQLWDAGQGIIFAIAVFTLVGLGAAAKFGAMPWRRFWSVMGAMTMLTVATSVVAELLTLDIDTYDNWKREITDPANERRAREIARMANEKGPEWDAYLRKRADQLWTEIEPGIGPLCDASTGMWSQTFPNGLDPSVCDTIKNRNILGAVRLNEDENHVTALHTNEDGSIALVRCTRDPSNPDGTALDSSECERTQTVVGSMVGKMKRWYDGVEGGGEGAITRSEMLKILCEGGTSSIEEEIVIENIPGSPRTLCDQEEG